MTEYTAITSNVTNTITVTPEAQTASVAITVNGSAHANGTAATWDEGGNTVVITVTDDTVSADYTVIVTKS